MNFVSDSISKVDREWLITRWIFFRCLGIVYLIAFGSYALQIIGLNGSQGVLPTSNLLSVVGEHMNQLRFVLFPTLAWFCSSDGCLSAMAIGGVLVSLLVTFGLATGPSLICAIVLWLSLVTGGGEFTEFQSDGMLIEASVLALLVAPWSLLEAPWSVPKLAAWGKRQALPSMVGIWLLRFMIFRFMFAAGAVKVLSGDPTWANLTALQYHFETQPLPTPLAWYVSQLPPLVLKGMTVGMFVSELAAPLLVFGTRWMRLIAAVLFCSLQVGITLTGNYTFLNYLTILLCISLIDDSLVKRFLPRGLVAKIEGSADETQVAADGAAVSSRKRWSVWARAIGACILFLLAGCQFIGTFTARIVPRALREVLMDLSPYHIADRYGLFAVMTTTRPEIVFEGSSNGTIWKPYEIRYQILDVRKAPPWVAPHMPRLSWRLWFAAMNSVEASPWVLGLVERMFQNSPPVMNFFETNPFPTVPPKYIRAWVYDYHFTNYKEKEETGNWWRRDNQREYLPPMQFQNGAIERAQP